MIKKKLQKEEFVYSDGTRIEAGDIIFDQFTCMIYHVTKEEDNKLYINYASSWHTTKRYIGEAMNGTSNRGMKCDYTKLGTTKTR